VEATSIMHAGVEWKRAPKNTFWWAVDEDGKAHWFKGPDVIPHTKFWFMDVIPAPSFGYEGDWRESLTKSPAL
jgi:hypothetical protein